MWRSFDSIYLNNWFLKQNTLLGLIYRFRIFLIDCCANFFLFPVLLFRSFRPSCIQEAVLTSVNLWKFLFLSPPPPESGIWVKLDRTTTLPFQYIIIICIQYLYILIKLRQKGLSYRNARRPVVTLPLASKCKVWYINLCEQVQIYYVLAVLNFVFSSKHVLWGDWLICYF